MASLPKQTRERRKSFKLRGEGDWEAERPLTYHFKDANMEKLGALATNYFFGKIEFEGMEGLRSQIPEGTNWLKHNLEQMKRCGPGDHLLVMGWCPIQDDHVDLDRAPVDACLTEQIVMWIEHVTKKKVLFIDYFPDCRQNQQGHCMGNSYQVQENLIHTICYQLTLTVAMREFGINITGAFGFSKLFVEEIAEAVFSYPPWLAQFPRSMVPFHIGQIQDANLEKRRLGTEEMIRYLVPLIGIGEKELYSSMKDWFEKHQLRFQLPDMPISSSNIRDRLSNLLGPLVPEGEEKPTVRDQVVERRKRPAPSLKPVTDRQDKKSKGGRPVGQKQGAKKDPRSPPQTTWPSLSQDMVVAERLLVAQGLTISERVEPPAAPIDEKGKPDYNAARKHKAKENLRRLKEAKEVLLDAKVLFQFPSLENFEEEE
ncbi:hypothetical protein PVAG01_01150 [Phlyctema vagabunda]|uniref:Uncharacterized protein n=1 Tax=Phlyctema vagabunda TaxID=108571 RepID=A0ABR4PXP8_9HELO